METVSEPVGCSFLDYFSVSCANTDAEIEAVQRVRYSVYCKEFAFEPSENFPDGRERDEFDAISTHCLITHRATGSLAGCVRLVPAAGEDGSGLLPMEVNCPGILQRPTLEHMTADRRQMCEISRMAVEHSFRRRQGESQTRIGSPDAVDITHHERRNFSLVAVSGFLAALSLSDITGRTAIFAMMERHLPKLLRRSGIAFQRAGPEVNYHGLRGPYFLNAESAVSNIIPEVRDLYKSIHRQLTQSYRPPPVNAA
jgi:N-acyl amino acid synthase of PEP-CTERM/exosortase system